jgi:hypothetical protein
MASLREIQDSFADALRPGADAAAIDRAARACELTPAANISIYRHNAQHAFHATLGLSFPVLQRRVGSDYFRQLAHRYRERCPSRSGDLHWVGRGFAEFLAEHLRDGDYAWLADLARLEWAREAASVSVEHTAMGADALASIAPEALEHIVFKLQPSLTLIDSPFPVFSVWFANQVENAPPVSQSLGAERGMVRIRADRVEVAQLAPDLFSFLSALAAGATLGQAMTAANADERRLTEGLAFVFNASLVSSIAPARTDA